MLTLFVNQVKQTLPWLNGQLSVKVAATVTDQSREEIEQGLSSSGSV